MLASLPRVLELAESAHRQMVAWIEYPNQVLRQSMTVTSFLKKYVIDQYTHINMI